MKYSIKIVYVGGVALTINYKTMHDAQEGIKIYSECRVSTHAWVVAGVMRVVSFIGPSNVCYVQYIEEAE